MQEVDLGVCGGHFFEEDPNRVAILLPGAFYLPAAPLLWFGREVLQSHGWSVLQVWDQRTQSVDAQVWVDERLEAALTHVGSDPAVMVLSKSLTSLAAPAVARMGVPAIWLTPLLRRSEVQSGFAASKSPALVVGGTADPLWDSSFAAGLAHMEVIEILGADHGIQIPGHPAQSVEALGTVVAAMDGFLGTL